MEDVAVNRVCRFIRKTAVPCLCSVLLFLCWGCAPEPLPIRTKDGQVYGKVDGAFRHRWWNYYERSLSYADGSFFEEAVADLNVALRMRGTDQRMARTYGMHFVDYFPHRELGIIYFRQGLIAEARQELETSLEQFPSAKAQYYLDRVRKAEIENAGKTAFPPSIILTVTEKEIRTKADPVIISGKAVDENYITGITIDGESVLIEKSMPKVHFEQRLSLTQGRHEIEITAKNLLEKTTTQTLVVHVDREGPVISIDDLQIKKDGQVYISGAADDDSGVRSLIIAGHEVPIKDELSVVFEHQFKPEFAELLITAVDRIGNEIEAGIDLSVVLGAVQDENASFSSTLLKRSIYASLSLNVIPVKTGIQESIGTPRIMLAGLDSDHAPWMLAALFGPKDKTPPLIKLRDWTENQTVFLEKIFLNGAISDDTGVEHLAINGQSILRRKGKQIYFTHMSELNEGPNDIVIEAADAGGNIASQEITVTREIPQVRQLSERLSIAVAPFDQKGEVSPASSSFQENITDALINRNRFRLVEREKLDIVLREQKLSQTDLVERDTAIRLGRLLAARTVLTGSINSSRIGTEIVARLIDTETSEIIASKDVYDEVVDLPGLRTLAEGLALKLHSEFPLVEGIVVDKAENAVFTDLGQGKTKLNRRLIIYREQPIKHPKTGKVLGAKSEIVGRAAVSEVMPELSKAELTSGEAESINPLDMVITE